MTFQAIINQSQTTTVMFNGKPSDETREKLRNAGFLYKGASRWVLNVNASQTATEQEVVAKLIAL